MALVYSTETGKICPECGKPVKDCKCFGKNKKKAAGLNIKNDGIVRLMRETKGRKGKGVTIITGLDLDEKDLKLLAKKLKQKCGTGGSVKDNKIEIQGDSREVLKKELENEGYRVKLAGG